MRFSRNCGRDPRESGDKPKVYIEPKKRTRPMSAVFAQVVARRYFQGNPAPKDGAFQCVEDVADNRRKDVEVDRIREPSRREGERDEESLWMEES